MTSAEKEALKRLRDLSECCICLMTYTDPRQLPCFHSACLECFEDIQTKNEKKPGDVLPCPLCRKEYTIPPEGVKGLPKNFFIESLMEVTKAVNFESRSLPCNTCAMMEDASDVEEATMVCLNCWEHYCLRCSKIHKSQKLGKEHKIVEINRPLDEEEIRKMFPIRNCKIHCEKVLDYYCGECKTVVCVSCFVEDHKLHECKDVRTVDKDFRLRLEENSSKIHEYLEQILHKKMDLERCKGIFLAKTLETENAIKRKNDQMKALIDQHTQAVLDELLLLKQKHQKNMEAEIEEMERKLAVLDSFVTYCTEVKSKGSPSEVCGCADSLISTAKDLSRENDEYLSTPSSSVEIEFIATEQSEIVQNVGNVIGKLSVSAKEFESFAIVIGGTDGHSISNDVIKINLNRPGDIISLQPLPSRMQVEAAAAVYCNSVFVTGVGSNCDEIWRYDTLSSNWKKCASMHKGRRRHSVAFVDHVLYTCGGYVDSSNSTLDDVEGYDVIDDNFSTVGKLIYAVRTAGNCVSFKASLYVFGGYDSNYEAMNNVQVYNTKLNTCTLLLSPMPVAASHLRAILCENTVVLLGGHRCLMYNFSTETWKMKDQFKTGVVHFGLTVNNGNVFVIGGGVKATDADGNTTWICRDDVRYIPLINFLNDKPIEWRQHAKLPFSSLVYGSGKIDFFV